MDYEDHIRRLKLDHAALAEELSPLLGLEGVMAWMARRGVPLASADIIAQDEYSLDFLIPLKSGGVHLVFGIT